MVEIQPKEFSSQPPLDRVESLKMDIYPRELVPGELDRSVLESVFDGEELPIASRTDVAISKLIWSSKGSPKSRRDFRKIYFSSKENDRNKPMNLTNR